MVNIVGKITTLRLERNWSEYQLAEAAGITQSTISSWVRKNALPNIDNLEKICRAFGITLSQFFSDGSAICLTEDQKEMLDIWNTLTKKQQESLVSFLKTL